MSPPGIVFKSGISGDSISDSRSVTPILCIRVYNNGAWSIDGLAFNPSAFTKRLSFANELIRKIIEEIDRGFIPSGLYSTFVAEVALLSENKESVNLFLNGCLFVDVYDYRGNLPASKTPSPIIDQMDTGKPPKYVRLKIKKSYADISKDLHELAKMVPLSNGGSLTENEMQLESVLLKEINPAICLDPSPHVFKVMSAVNYSNKMKRNIEIKFYSSKWAAAYEPKAGSPKPNFITKSSSSNAFMPNFSLLNALETYQGKNEQYFPYWPSSSNSINASSPIASLYPQSRLNDFISAPSSSFMSSVQCNNLNNFLPLLSPALGDEGGYRRIAPITNNPKGPPNRSLKICRDITANNGSGNVSPHSKKEIIRHSLFFQSFPRSDSKSMIHDCVTTVSIEAISADMSISQIISSESYKFILGDFSSVEKHLESVKMIWQILNNPGQSQTGLNTSSCSQILFDVHGPPPSHNSMNTQQVFPTLPAQFQPQTPMTSSVSSGPFSASPSSTSMGSFTKRNPTNFIQQHQPFMPSSFYGSPAGVTSSAIAIPGSNLAGSTSKNLNPIVNSCRMTPKQGSSLKVTAPENGSDGNPLRHSPPNSTESKQQQQQQQQKKMIETGTPSSNVKNSSPNMPVISGLSKSSKPPLYSK